MHRYVTASSGKGLSDLLVLSQFDSLQPGGDIHYDDDDCYYLPRVQEMSLYVYQTTLGI